MFQSYTRLIYSFFFIILSVSPKAQSYQQDSSKAATLLAEAKYATGARQYAQAQAYCEQAAQLFAKHTAQEQIYFCQHQRIRNLIVWQKSSQAFVELQQLIKTGNQELNSNSLVWVFLRATLAGLLLERGQQDSAKTCLELAQQTLTQTRPQQVLSQEAELYLLTRWVNYYYAIGQADVALQYGQQAFSFCKNNPNLPKQLLVETYLDLTFRQLQSGQLQVYPKEIGIAKNLLQQIPKPSLSIQYQAIMFDFYWNYTNRNKEKAKMAMDKMNQFVQEHWSKDTTMYVQCLVNTGVYHKDLCSDYPKGIEYFEKAVQLYQNRSLDFFDTQRAMAMLNLGQAVSDMGKRQYANAVFEDLLLLLLPQYPKGTPISKIDFARPDLVCRNLSLVGRVLYMQMSHYSDSCSHQESPSGCAKWYEYIQTYSQFVEYQYRFAANESDIKLKIGELDKINWTQKTSYARLNAKHHRKEHIDSLLRTLDRSHAIYMHRNLSKDKAFEIAGIPKSLQDQYQSLNVSIRETEKRLQIAYKESDKTNAALLLQQLLDFRKQEATLNLDIEKKYPKYKEILQSRPEISLAKVQEQLPNETALVQCVSYFERASNTLIILKDTAFYLPAAFAEIRPIEEFQNLQKMVQSFLANTTQVETILENPQKAYQDFIRSAYTIYRYTSSFDSVLQHYNIKQVVLLPNRFLAQLPYELLIRTMPTDTINPNYADLDYLCKHYSFSYAPSMSIWLHYQQQKQKLRSGKILGFAPNYPPSPPMENRSPSTQALRKQLIDLPGAKAELEALEKAYGGNYFFGNDANEAQFKKSNFSDFSVLHLAMHGLLNAQNPNQSSLAFTETGDSSQDNFVYAYEIAQLQIPSNLVVLSACETGAGKSEELEGVLSLGRFFLYAGTPSVVMTRWAVNDAATAFIMQEFYKHLHAGLPKQEALRQAQLSYLRQANPKAQHPFFWAAPFVMGDTRPIVLYSNDDLRKQQYWYYGGGATIIISLFLIAMKMRKRKKYRA